MRLPVISRRDQGTRPILRLDNRRRTIRQDSRERRNIIRLTSLTGTTIILCSTSLTGIMTILWNTSLSDIILIPRDMNFTGRRA